MKKRAFTLAEVLITLGIIGVVAAITMPVLIQSYQKQVTATSVQKAYSELNQIINRAKADYGDPSGWDYYGEDELDKWVQTYIEPYVNVIGRTDSCISNEKCLGLALPAALKVQENQIGNSSVGQYVITKTGNPFGYSFLRYGGVYEPVTRVRVYIRNSMKYPKSNKKVYAIIGKDIFTFIFDRRENNPSFKPYGLEYSRDVLLHGPIRAGGCFKESGGPDYYGPGDGCAAVIMMDGWKISKDYPW